jgi:hypothetical protein
MFTAFFFCKISGDVSVFVVVLYVCNFYGFLVYDVVWSSTVTKVLMVVNVFRLLDGDITKI